MNPLHHPVYNHYVQVDKVALIVLYEALKVAVQKRADAYRNIYKGNYHTERINEVTRKWEAVNSSVIDRILVELNEGRDENGGCEKAGDIVHIQAGLLTALEKSSYEGIEDTVHVQAGTLAALGNAEETTNELAESLDQRIYNINNS
jgi:hypothetical protein